METYSKKEKLCIFCLSGNCIRPIDYDKKGNKIIHLDKNIHIQKDIKKNIREIIFKGKNKKTNLTLEQYRIIFEFLAKKLKPLKNHDQIDSNSVFLEYMNEVEEDFVSYLKCKGYDV